MARARSPRATAPLPGPSHHSRPRRAARVPPSAAVVVRQSAPAPPRSQPHTRRGDSEHPWVRPGRLFTSGPGTYKIPSANDVPLDFRVSLLKGAGNPRAVYSSKAVGEPPFLLAMSVFFAAKDAVEAARADAGLTGWRVPGGRGGAGRGSSRSGRLRDWLVICADA